MPTFYLGLAMDPFSPSAPEWTATAAHAHEFCCPQCRSGPLEAHQVWINRRSPVYTEDYRKKWQEFYRCSCQQAWWAWSSDRPPTELESSKTEADKVLEIRSRSLEALLYELENLDSGSDDGLF
nr:hypothetical protein [Prochlorothrix hollandica]